MRKKRYIFKNFAKRKKVFLPISIILYLIPIEIPKKFKIEAPYWLVTSRLGTGNSLTFFYSARTDLSLGGVVLGPFVVAGLQTDCVRTVRMQGVGIHIPGGDTLALALYTPPYVYTYRPEAKP